MLDLYLDNLIIGKKFCNMFSLLYDITLQTKLFKRKLVPNNVCLFFDKKSNTNVPAIKNTDIFNIKTLPEPGNKPGASRSPVRCVTSGPPSQLKLWYASKAI